MADGMGLDPNLTSLFYRLLCYLLPLVGASVHTNTRLAAVFRITWPINTRKWTDPGCAGPTSYGYILTYQGGAGHVIIPATRRGAAWNISNLDGGTGRALGEGWERREREGKKSWVVGRLFSYIEELFEIMIPREHMYPCWWGWGF